MVAHFAAQEAYARLEGGEITGTLVLLAPEILQP